MNRLLLDSPNEIIKGVFAVLGLLSQEGEVAWRLIIEEMKFSSVAYASRCSQAARLIPFISAPFPPR